MSDSLKVVRFVSGEVAVFENAFIEDKDKILMRNPHILVQTPNGVMIQPMMPWVKKGTDYKLEIQTIHVLVQFPSEHCEMLFDLYRRATSPLELPPAANVTSIRG